MPASRGEALVAKPTRGRLRPAPARSRMEAVDFDEAASREGDEVTTANDPTTFRPAPDGVDPARVPTRTLASGAKVPVIGLGTFGSDRFSAEQIAAAVLEAASVGYRHFDCASVYSNEAQVGRSLRTILDSGISDR